MLDQIRATARALRGRLDLPGLVWVLGRGQAGTRPAGLPTTTAVLDLCRWDVTALRFAFDPGGSTDGGWDEFVESLPTRARSAATSASNAAIRAFASSRRVVASFNRPVSSTTNSANCSYVGGSTVDIR